MCLESEREGPIGDVDSNISDSDIRMKQTGWEKNLNKNENATKTSRLSKRSPNLEN